MTARACTLYWFTDDLRLHDNAALSHAAASSDALLCVYCVDPIVFKTTSFGTTRMGPMRWRFIEQALADLAISLAQRGQRLVVLQGNSIEMISNTIARNNIDKIVRSARPAVYEQWQWRSLQQRFPYLDFTEVETHTLFNRDQLPFAAPGEALTGASLPGSFSSFRKKVEPLAVKPPKPAPTDLPAPINIAVDALDPNVTPAMPESAQLSFQGGQQAALQHMANYFDSPAAFHYKQTRNALAGWDTSSKFSPWLATGALSARQLYARLKDYEADNGSNDSTYWLYFELLWREYFQWYAQAHKHRLFRFGGLQDKRPLTSFYAERFRKWSTGQTPWPIVNACMNELNATGYMSNRGRQIVASCLVNELALDWRCGAAYFEQQLLDYDVASNWGNWQYIAGVGADPRGGRHFNLEKQTREHDPDGIFIAQWAPHAASPVLDSVDMVDWPVVQGTLPL